MNLPTDHHSDCYKVSVTFYFVRGHFAVQFALHMPADVSLTLLFFAGRVSCYRRMFKWVTFLRPNYSEVAASRCWTAKPLIWETMNCHTHFANYRPFYCCGIKDYKVRATGQTWQKLLNYHQIALWKALVSKETLVLPNELISKLTTVKRSDYHHFELG